MAVAAAPTIPAPGRRPPRRRTLRRTLTTILLPLLLLLVGAEQLVTWRTAADSANLAYDRSLYGAIRAIDANISTDSGGLAVELPFRMLEFFALTAQGDVYFHVGTEDGMASIGHTDLPPPGRPLDTGRPRFEDAVYFGVPVRIGHYARNLDPPLGGHAAPQRVIIQVAETLGSREAFTLSLVTQAVARDVVLVLAAAALLVVVVGWALRPLRRLRQQVQGRAPQDLTPIEPADVPAEVAPLVDAINLHMARVREQTSARMRLIDDASHQLRTPLTTLSTQVDVALREQDPQRLHPILLAIRAQLDTTVRQTNQMLALARSDHAELQQVPFEPAQLAQRVTRAWWTRARARGIDLGFVDEGSSGAAAPVVLCGYPELLEEALANLLDNALRYTPQGGMVTMTVHTGAQRLGLEVSDNGPGIPRAELDRIGARFFRASNVALPGSGLGLAIARSIAERHGGTLQAALNPAGEGLCVTLWLPLTGG